MITRTGIKALCNSTTYKRGQDIYRSDDKISEFRVKTDEETDVADALIKGSSSQYYQVKIKYDKKRDCLDNVYCDCTAFYNNDGICRHCVAALLEYVDYRSRQAAIEAYAEAMEKPPSGFTVPGENTDTGSVLGQPDTNTGNFSEGRGWISDYFTMANTPAVFSKQTTSGVKLLLSRHLMRRTAPLLEKEYFGKVRLDVYLKCNGRSIQAEFKIGTTRMYVLKDIFEFVRNMKDNVDFAYGQKLQFVHMQEAFEPDSISIVQFIMNWEAQNRDRYIQQMHRGYAYTGEYPKIRVLPLTERELEELLEAVGEREFTAQIENGGERAWQVTEGRPERVLTLTGKNDGLEVRLSQLYGVWGEKYYICFQEGKVYRILRAELAAVEGFINCMEQLPGNWAFVYKSDIPVFARELLPELEKYFLCARENFYEEKYGAVHPAYEIYLDEPEKDWITCRVNSVYGQQKYSIFDTRDFRQIRDLPGEMAVGALVSPYFNSYDEEKKALGLSGDEEKLYELLTEGIPRMQELGEVFVSETLKRIRVMEPPRVKLGISLSYGLLDLDIQAENMTSEQLMEILSRYDRKKKFYRLKNGSFLNMDDARFEALMELKEGLHLTSRQLKHGNIQVPAYRAMYLDTQLKEGGLITAAKDRNFRALIRNMKTVDDNDFEIPKEQEKILREYQKQGFLWIKTLKQNGFGGILADDMGLGKTLQIITFLWSEYSEAQEGENKRCLIITPASLVFNWASEIEQFAPGLPVRMIVGTAQEREKLIKNASERDVLITSYDLLRRDVLYYEEMSFYCQVIDEAQYIKNQGTQAAKAVKSVKADFKMALTGTPVENRLSELWSIFDYLMPGFLYSYEQFRREIEQPAVLYEDKRAKERLQKMIRPFVLRRLKKDVLKDLPDKIEKNMFARLEGEQETLYEAHVKRVQEMLGRQTEEEFRTSKFQLLAEITRLRQICCHPGLLYEDYRGNSEKLDMCMELIQNAAGAGHKILLFSQFTTMLELLIKRLEEENISYYTLTGETSKEKRSDLVKAFNQDDTSVFCISLKAGGTGLNLTAADIVIHYDPWWNVAVQNQATDRAHRIGQKNVVSVYKLFVKGTIEEKIKKLQDRKRELADEILAGEGIDSGRMSKEELMDLLQNPSGSYENK